MSDARPDHASVNSSVPDHPIRYPIDTVLGVVDDRERLDAIVGALLDGGFMASELEITTGSAAADAVQATTGRTGLAGLAVRLADKLGAQDEEMEYKRHYEQAMRDGRFVVMVKTPSEERKQRAAEVLREHGAHSVSFHGRFTIEGLVPPNEK